MSAVFHLFLTKILSSDSLDELCDIAMEIIITKMSRSFNDFSTFRQVERIGAGVFVEIASWGNCGE